MRLHGGECVRKKIRDSRIALNPYPAVSYSSENYGWGTMQSFDAILLYFGILVGFAASILILTHTIGPRKKTAVKEMPYESGMDPVGDARQPFDTKFYLVAILFLVFDVELLFLYPWAVSAYVDGPGVPVELRTTVFCVMLVFMATLAIAYVYAWRKGVFKWR